MAKVIFKYDVSKDIWNILRVTTTDPFFDKENTKRILSGLDDALLKELKNEEDLLVKENMIKKYIDNFLVVNKYLIENKIELFNKEWSIINDIYFERLGNILDIKISDNTYISYLTNAGSCPFNAKERWFMVRIKDEKIDTVAAHEIMHIEFVRNYGFFCRDLGLTSKQFDNLREGLTVLLNEEMGDILSRPDYGYKEHQEIRKRIIDIWRKNKDIKNLIKEFQVL